TTADLPSSGPASEPAAPVIDLDAPGGHSIEALTEVADANEPAAPEPVPSIQPPQHFNKEEREYFASLTPEMQAAVARQEAGRLAYFRRAQNEQSELLKRTQLEQENIRQRVESEVRAQYEQAAFAELRQLGHDAAWALEPALMKDLSQVPE